MQVTKKDRLRVGFERLGIAVGVITVPGVWSAILLSDGRTNSSQFFEYGLLSAVIGIAVWFVVRFVPVWVVRVTGLAPN